MQQLTKDVYAETNVRGANVGFVVTGEGVVLIDSPMIPSEARWWREQIAAITDQEIIYLINTDHHRGHVLGNQYLATAVIAHELAWKEMKSYGDSFRQRLINRFIKDDELEVALEGADLPGVEIDAEAGGAVGEAVERVHRSVSDPRRARASGPIGLAASSSAARPEDGSDRSGP